MTDCVKIAKVDKDVEMTVDKIMVAFNLHSQGFRDIEISKTGMSAVRRREICHVKVKSVDELAVKRSRF